MTDRNSEHDRRSGDSEPDNGQEERGYDPGPDWEEDEEHVVGETDEAARPDGDN